MNNCHEADLFRQSVAMIDADLFPFDQATSAEINRSAARTRFVETYVATTRVDLHG
jgi:hypothetical protein